MTGDSMFNVLTDHRQALLDAQIGYDIERGSLYFDGADFIVGERHTKTGGHKVTLRLDKIEDVPESLDPHGAKRSHVSAVVHRILRETGDEVAR